MPLTQPGIVGAIVSNLVATAHLGMGVPKLATGIANGVMTWIPKVRAQSVDVGSLGVGRGVGALVVPSPALIAALTAGFTAQGILGVYAPLTISGLGNGLSLAFAQGQILTTHASVGVGTGVVKLLPPPATMDMISGFASVEMTGEGSRRFATAIGTALTTVFAGLLLPTMIAGTGSTSAGGGTGFGGIL